MNLSCGILSLVRDNMIWINPQFHCDMALQIWILVSLSHVLVFATACATNVEECPGHMKPLGEGRPVHHVQKVEGFPHTQWFFKNFVHQAKPLLMKNAAKLSPAFTRWSDEYFVDHQDPAEDHMVRVELQKGERCAAETNFKMIPFKEFVRQYNDSDFYMVSDIPKFMRPDMVLPGPLQCPDIMARALVEHVIWFSSGGTKSVLHYDDVDNINCLIRGEKEFLVVPEEFTDIIDQGVSFCDLDVDKANFTMFPGCAEAEYHKVFLEAGDCLYVPYKMFHQVRSYGSNLAVNVWWDYFLGLQVDLNNCPDQFNQDITLDKAVFKGLREKKLAVIHIKDHFEKHARHEALSLEQTIQIILRNVIDILKEIDPDEEYMAFVIHIFSMLDTNNDEMIDHDEAEGAQFETWEEIMKELVEYERMVSAMEKRVVKLSGNDNNEPLPNTDFHKHLEL